MIFCYRPCFLLFAFIAALSKGMGWGLGSRYMSQSSRHGSLFCFFHGSEKTIPNYAIHLFFCASLLSRKQLHGGGGVKGGKLVEQRRIEEEKVVASCFEYSE
jgi:hypothetical protein